MSGYAQTKMMHWTSGRNSSPSPPNPHPNITCNNCNSAIGTVRYACLDCKDFDLCARCESVPSVSDGHFQGQHLFAKVRDSAKVNVTKYRQ